jgi:hypothetical protein
MKIGINLKLTKLWHRALASYLRAIAVALGSASLINAAGKPDLAAVTQLLIALVAALIAPLIMLFTEAADILENLDKPADGSTPPGA